MRGKEILSLVAIMVIGLIVYLVTREKDMNLRLTKVEGTLNNILNNSDQTRLALACMIQDQETVEVLDQENRTPIGFKQGTSENS